jgi:prepilin-type N-terminal cleavage/methylation domain-containing protein
MVLAESTSVRRDSGFSLVEVLVATTLLAVALVGLAQLAGIAVRANTSARGTTFATMLAQQKLEQLRELQWAFDTAGAPVSDLATNLAVTPATQGGNGLAASPAGTLTSNTAGYVDYLDATGNWVGTGAQPASGTVYIRRWSIDALPADPGNTLILQVFVTHIRSRNAAGAAGGSRLSDQARLLSLKTRRSQ